MTNRLLFLAGFGGLLAAGVITAGVAHADPQCVGPDGSPCPVSPPGCVDPDTNLPCSSSLPDINAAIRNELQKILGGMR